MLYRRDTDFTASEIKISSCLLPFLNRYSILVKFLLSISLFCSNSWRTFFNTSDFVIRSPHTFDRCLNAFRYNERTWSLIITWFFVTSVLGSQLGHHHHAKGEFSHQSSVQLISVEFLTTDEEYIRKRSPGENKLKIYSPGHWPVAGQLKYQVEYRYCHWQNSMNSTSWRVLLRQSLKYMNSSWTDARLW